MRQLIKASPRQHNIDSKMHGQHTSSETAAVAASHYNQGHQLQGPIKNAIPIHNNLRENRSSDKKTLNSKNVKICAIPLRYVTMH